MARKIQNIIVTGGSGYIGSVLLPMLVEKGYNVTNIDAGYFGHDSIKHLKGVKTIEKDVRDCVADDLAGADAVIHLAGFSNDPTAEFGPSENYSINAGGTIRLAKLAKQNGIKHFIFGSTCSVYYSPVPTDEMKDEYSLVDSRAPYSLSKYLGEIALAAEADKTFTPIIFRQGTVYGYSPRMRYDLVINTFLKDAFKNGELNLHHGGVMWRPLLYIKDAARAYIYALEELAPSTTLRTYNLASCNLRISELAHHVKDILKKEHGKDIKLTIQDLQGMAHAKPEDQGKVFRSYRVATDAFKKEGFVFEDSLAGAIRDIWLDIKKHPNDLDATRFYNIHRFQELFGL